MFDRLSFKNSPRDAAARIDAETGAGIHRTAIARSGALALGAALILGITLTGCGNEPSAGDAPAGADQKSIGVLQLTQHPALDAANKGFIEALDEAGIDYTADQQNASNDLSSAQSIASKLVGDGDDLIFAIGTPAVQAVAGATSDIPVVGTAVTDFEASGLVESNDAPGRNVTGTSDLTPVERQMELLHEVLPDARKVGILFCSAESNSEIQAELAEKALDELGIGHERFIVSSTNEVQSVMESIAGASGADKVDAIYTPTDNTIASSMAQIAQIALENKIPTVCGEKAHVEAGGLFSLSIDYEKLGHRAGEMAVQILNGDADPADMPIEHLSDDELELVVNDETAAALGLDLSGLTA